MSNIKEIILDLVTSYENKVTAVEALIDVASRVVRESNGDLSKACQEREDISTRLQEILARNCSLRKRDFETMMRGVLLAFEEKRARLEEEQKRVEERFKEYLSKEKERTALMRERLLESNETEGLEQALRDIRAKQENEVEHILALLRDFRLRVETFNREQEELNRGLRRLLNKGELLKIEDIRGLKSTEARSERHILRRTRREEVERLLRRFGRERRKVSPGNSVNNRHEKED